MKRYGIVTALFLALIGITACGDAAGEAETGEKQTESEAEVKEVELWDSEKELEGELVIRSMLWDEKRQFMVDKFMEMHSGVTIEVDVPEQSIFLIDSSDEEEKIYEPLINETNKIVTELMGDAAADIYDVGQLTAFSKGLDSCFEDLYDYMEVDSDINPEDYYTNVLEACEYNGHLYAIPSYFYYDYIRLNKKIVEGTDLLVDEEVDYSDLLEIWEQAEEQGLINEDMLFTKNGWIINSIYDMEEAICMDWEQGECFFDSPNFIECLNAMKEMRAEFPYYLYEVGDNKSVAENEFFSAFMHCYYNYSKSLIQEGSKRQKLLYSMRRMEAGHLQWENRNLGSTQEAAKKRLLGNL